MPQPTDPCPHDRTAHMSVHIIKYNHGTQYSTEQFW